MQVIIKFNTDNESFQADPARAISDTLGRVSSRLLQLEKDGVKAKEFAILDIDGNRIGEFKQQISRARS